jgi:5-methylthioadenosine/S-adenosylhomocysteine deaminase
MSHLLIRDCDILQIENGEVNVAVNQDISVKGNRIDAIGPTGTLTINNSPEVVDGSGCLATPGFINTHAHVSMVLFRGIVEDVSVESWFNDHIWPLESNLTPEDVYWGSLLGIAEMIENGVTHVADHYFFMDEVARAVSEAGIRANLVWTTFGHEGESKLDQSCEFVQRWQDSADGRITTWLGPHAPYTTGPDYLELCARKARELHVGIHTHVSETEEQVALSLKEFNLTPVQMLAESGVFEVPTILAHCLYPAEDDLAIMAQANTGVAHAPKTYLKIGMGMVPLGKFLTADVPVGLATDGAVSNNSLDILGQLQLMALSQKHTLRDSTSFPVSQALEIAFQGSAKVLQMEDDLCAIQPGKLADICLLRQDGLHVYPRHDPAANLVYSSRASDVDTVICDGKVLMHKRKLLTIDKSQVKREIGKRLDRLSQRVEGTRIATYPA